MREDLLAVTDCAGNESYIDLKVNKTYPEIPDSPVSYTQLPAHETDQYLLSRLLLETTKNS